MVSTGYARYIMATCIVCVCYVWLRRCVYLYTCSYMSTCLLCAIDRRETWEQTTFTVVHRWDRHEMVDTGISGGKINAALSLTCNQ